MSTAEKNYENKHDKNANPKQTHMLLSLLNVFQSAELFHLLVVIRQMSCLMTKPAKWYVRPAKTQISLGIRQVWSESSLSAWRKLGSLATHWAHSEVSDQTGRMPRLIWVFAGRTVILLILSLGGSNNGKGNGYYPVNIKSWPKSHVSTCKSKDTRLWGSIWISLQQHQINPFRGPSSSNLSHIIHVIFGPLWSFSMPVTSY